MRIQSVLIRSFISWGFDVVVDDFGSEVGFEFESGGFCKGEEVFPCFKGVSADVVVADDDAVSSVWFEDAVYFGEVFFHIG